MTDISTSAPISARAAMPPATDAVTHEILSVLRGIRPLQANGQPYDDEARLTDAGFTSLEMVKVMLAVEGSFDLLIPPQDITPGNFMTAATIAAMVQRLRSA